MNDVTMLITYFKITSTMCLSFVKTSNVIHYPNVRENTIFYPWSHTIYACIKDFNPAKGHHVEE